jgi:hypothetical protein
VLSTGAHAVAQRPPSTQWNVADLANWIPPPESFDLLTCLYVHVAGCSRPCCDGLPQAPASTP